MSDIPPFKIFQEILECGVGDLNFRDNEGNRKLIGYSFVIKSVNEVFMDGRQQKLWFKSRAAAVGCAKDAALQVVKALRAKGYQAETYST